MADLKQEMRRFSTRSWCLGVVALGVAGAATVPSEATASHFRMANFTWKLDATGDVRFVGQTAWRAGAANGIGFGWIFDDAINEPGSFGDIGTLTGPFTGPDGNPYEIREHDFTFKYSGAGPFKPSWTGNARVDTLGEGGSQPWRLSLVVDLRGGNQGPPAVSAPALIAAPSGGSWTYQIPVVDPDGDSFACSLAPESSFTFQPDGLTISAGCELSWNTTGLAIGTTWPFQLTVTETEADHQASSVFDGLLTVVDQALYHPPTCTGADDYRVAPGATLTIPFVGTDPEGAAVTSALLGSFPGSTFTPTSGASPLTSTFSWSPAVGDLGVRAGTVLFTDPLFAQALCGFTVDVCSDCDGDGYKAVAFGGDDCDDTLFLVNPGPSVTENCTDGIDNECDGAIDAADRDCGGDTGTCNPGGCAMSGRADSPSGLAWLGLLALLGLARGRRRHPALAGKVGISWSHLLLTLTAGGVALLVPAAAEAQFTIVPTNDATVLADALLGGTGAVTITSSTYSGAATASGTYTDGPMGIANGVILTSGSALAALPPDNSGSTGTVNGEPGDPLCGQLTAPYNSFDRARLDIVFDLAAGYDGISFQLIFGSEEYPEYLGQGFNDSVGVWLNGTDVSNQIAFDASGNAVNINGGFFNGGSVVTPPTNGLEYDGSTGLLLAQGALTGGSTGNELHIVVCDASDSDLDSGALLATLNGCIGNNCTTGVVTCADVDNDNDGESSCADCNDTDPLINPSATELCNGVDDDCNGTADFAGGEDDADADGFLTCDNDCDDTNPAVNPGVTELCNGIDDDCNGTADFAGGETDGDTDGFLTCDGDCDDAVATINPGVTELCNGVDDDCNGTADFAGGEDDADADGFRTCESDCDDAAAAINPDAVEICDDTVDQDCDGSDLVCEDEDEDVDADGDGATVPWDCDDSNPAVNPLATEVCNGIDDDCDSLTDEMTDDDGDGLDECDGDCDDANPNNFPGNTEVCDGQDNDCDPTGLEDEVDLDYDGFRLCDDDCDDTNAAVFPDAPEICNAGVDDDCDPSTDEDDIDADGDGFGLCSGDDCDDSEATANADGVEDCDDGVDNDCDAATDGDDADCGGTGGTCGEAKATGCSSSMSGPATASSGFALVGVLAFFGLSVRRRRGATRMGA